MRTQDPSGVVDDFCKQIDEVRAYFERIALLLAGTQTEKGDLSRLAEQTFVSAAVAFEGFFSDFIVACVNQNPEALQNDLEARSRQATEKNVGLWARDHIQLKCAPHLTVAEIQSILNPSGWNITAKNASDLQTKADRWLTGVVKSNIQKLTSDDKDLIDCVKAMRNFVAHRSEFAYERMNEALDKVYSHRSTRHLGRSVTRPGHTRRVYKVGSFLKAEVGTGGERRILAFLGQLTDIAESLRP